MIRKFKPEDLNDIMEIWLNTNIQAHDFISKSYWVNNFEMVKEILPTSEIYIYEEDKIKGFMGIIDGYIAGIFVLAAEQGKGIGKHLIDAAKEKYDKLTLNVYEKNVKSACFYEKQGFRAASQSVDVNTEEIEIGMIWEKDI